MEVRCGKCNKLFRVSDDKITGRGIKFTCTRCGEYVKITRGDFESSMQAQSAVSSPGVFEPAVGPSSGPVPGPEYANAGTAATLPSDAEGAGIEEAAGQGHKTEELPTPLVPDFLQEREEPPSPEPYPFEESPPMMEQLPHAETTVPSEPVQEEMRAVPVKEPEAPVVPDLRDEPVIAAETEQEPAPVPEPELDAKAGPEYARKSEQGPEPVSEQKPAATAVTTAGTGTEAVPAVQARPAAPVVSATSGVLTAASAKGPVHQAGTIPPRAAKVTALPETARSGRWLAVMLAAFLILGLAGLGAYLYVRSTPPAVKDSGTGMVSIEGLEIINPVGSLDANGDLLVSGVLENTTDRERAEWYIAVEVFDAKGTALNTMRMLNGKQIYTKRDYELLVKRGANVQELKAKALQAQGVVLPPKGKTAFELRYLQPPAGIASFNATLQPFDPARLLKEIEGETR